MSKNALPCIACGNPLRNVFDDVENQPSDGVAFQSHGHYGSTVWDPMDGQYIEINICDACLRAHADRVLMGRNRRPVLCDGAVVGWEHVSRPLLPWNPDLPTPDQEDHVVVEADEIGSDPITYTHEGRIRIEWTPGGLAYKKDVTED